MIQFVTNSSIRRLLFILTVLVLPFSKWAISSCLNAVTKVEKLFPWDYVCSLLLCSFVSLKMISSLDVQAQEFLYRVIQVFLTGGFPAHVHSRVPNPPMVSSHLTNLYKLKAICPAVSTDLTVALIYDLKEQRFQLRFWMFSVDQWRWWFPVSWLSRNSIYFFKSSYFHRIQSLFCKGHYWSWLILHWNPSGQ